MSRRQLRSRVGWCTAACLMLLLCLGCATARPLGPSLFCMADAEGPCGAPTQAEAEPILRAVFNRILLANDLPDRQLLPASPPFFVRDVPGRLSKLRVTTASLPSTQDFLVRSVAQLQKQADESGKSVYFIAIDSIEVSEALAEVIVSVEEAIPAHAISPQSCCTTWDRYQAVDGQWRFVQRAHTVCP